MILNRNFSCLKFSKITILPWLFITIIKLSWRYHCIPFFSAEWKFNNFCSIVNNYSFVWIMINCYIIRVPFSSRFSFIKTSIDFSTSWILSSTSFCNLSKFNSLFLSIFIMVNPVDNFSDVSIEFVNLSISIFLKNPQHQRC